MGGGGGGGVSGNGETSDSGVGSEMIDFPAQPVMLRSLAN